MPRYFFHLFDQNHLRDYEGVEMADDESAIACACGEAAGIAELEHQDGSLHPSHRIEITDEHGRAVRTVTFAEAFRDRQDLNKSYGSFSRRVADKLACAASSQ